MTADRPAVRDRALALLARREHSARELANKLAARGYQPEEIEELLARLRAEGLQSDQRFAENYIYHRVERGYGPFRIRVELHEKGVDADVIDACLQAAETDWNELMADVRRKKFGDSPPADYKEQARQSRFLRNHGFAPDQIRRLFRDDEQI